MPFDMRGNASDPSVQAFLEQERRRREQEQRDRQMGGGSLLGRAPNAPQRPGDVASRQGQPPPWAGGPGGGGYPAWAGGAPPGRGMPPPGPGGMAPPTSQMPPAPSGLPPGAAIRPNMPQAPNAATGAPVQSMAPMFAGQGQPAPAQQALQNAAMGAAFNRAPTAGAAPAVAGAAGAGAAAGGGFGAAAAPWMAVIAQYMDQQRQKEAMRRNAQQGILQNRVAQLGGNMAPIQAAQAQQAMGNAQGQNYLQYLPMLSQLGVPFARGMG